MLTRDVLKKKATKCNSSNDWLVFKQKRNEVNPLVKKTKKLDYENEIKNNLGNSKGTLRILNNLMGEKSKTVEMNKINLTSCESVTQSKDIANALNAHFTEIGPNLAS